MLLGLLTGDSHASNDKTKLSGDSQANCQKDRSGYCYTMFCLRDCVGQAQALNESRPTGFHKHIRNVIIWKPRSMHTTYKQFFFVRYRTPTEKDTKNCALLG
jgi:hypothetical protein